MSSSPARWCRTSNSWKPRTGSLRARWCTAAVSSGCSASTCRRPMAGSISTKRRPWSSWSGSHNRPRSRPHTAHRRTSVSCRWCCSAPRSRSRKYLPKLVSGETVGAYALSESDPAPTAGGAHARHAAADGSWVLTREDVISNGGFADVIIVFAKVDGEHFTAFIVEKSFPGFSSGKEEHRWCSMVPPPADHSSGCQGAGRKRCSAKSAGSQSRPQHAQLRTVQPGRHVHGRSRSAIGDA